MQLDPFTRHKTEQDAEQTQASEEQHREALLAAGALPTVPLKGNLELDAEQERRLVELAMQRFEEAMASRTMRGEQSWLGRRNEATAHFNNDFSARKKPDTIYQFSNLSMNLPKRYTRVTAARAFDELLGADPILAVIQEGAEDDKDEPAVLERFCAHKIGEIRLKEVLREATVASCVRGEAVIKVTWKKELRRSRRKALVLHNKAGLPIFSRDGNPVVLGDAWENDADGRVVLVRDPKVVMPDPPVYKMMLAEFRKVIRDGLDVKCLNHADFFCSTTAADIAEADFCCQLFDWPEDQVEGLLAPVQNTPEARAFLRKLRASGANSQARSQEKQPSDLRGEEEESQAATPMHPFIECYMRVTFEEDGVADEIMMLLDVENRQPIFYDYLNNVSPTGNRPFVVVRIEPVPGRWYGTGFYELFSDRHKFVDLFLNRVNFRSSLSGSIRIENPLATEEGLTGEQIEFGTNKVYRLRPDHKINEVFKVITVPDDSNSSKDMLNMLLQTTQLEAGMVSAGDAGIGALPSSGLATGIKSLDKVANLILKNLYYDLLLGYEAVLKDCVAAILSRYNPKEAIDLMGEDNAKILERCRDISSLPYRVKLLLSNARDGDIIEANRQALEVADSFYGLSPELQKLLKPLFVQMLQGLQINGPEQLLIIGQSKEEALALTQGGPGGGGQPGGVPVPSVGAGQAQLPMPSSSAETQPSKFESGFNPNPGEGVSASAPEPEPPPTAPPAQGPEA